MKTPFRANATRAAGAEPDEDAQDPAEVAALTLRAVAREVPVVETSAFVRFARAASRLTPAGLWFALRRMARKR